MVKISRGPSAGPVETSGRSVLVVTLLLLSGLLALAAHSATVVRADSPGNDDYAHAETLPVNGHVNGTVNASVDSADYYKMDLAGGEVLDVLVKCNSTSEGQIKMTVVEVDHTGYPTGEVLPGHNASIRLVIGNTKNGIYYIIIDELAYLNASYDIYVTKVLQDDAGLGGDARTDPKNAAIIWPGPVNKAQLGVLDDIDCYAIDIIPGAKVTVHLTVEPGNGRLTFNMFNATSDEVLDSFPDVGAGSEHVFSSMLNSTRGGRYILQASTTTPDLNFNYTFSIQVTGQKDATAGTDAPEEPLASAMSGVASTGDIKGELGYMDQGDCFRFITPPANGLALNITHNDPSHAMQVWFPNSALPIFQVEPSKTKKVAFWFDATDLPLTSMCANVDLNSGPVMSYVIEMGPVSHNDAGTGKDVPNDLLGTFVIPSGNYTLNGSVGSNLVEQGGDSGDFYNFTVPKFHNVSVRFSVLKPNMNVSAKLFIGNPFVGGQILLDQQVYSTSPATYTGVTEGKNVTYGILMAPREGRVDYKVEIKTEFALDRKPPELNVAGPITPNPADPNVHLEGTASDERGMARVESSMNGSAWTPCATENNWKDWSCKFLLKVGKSVLTIRAVDLAGNAKNWTMTFDWTPPGLSLTVIEPQGEKTVGNSSFRIYGNVGGGFGEVQVLVSTDNGNTWKNVQVQTGNWEEMLTLNEGTNNILVKAKDDTGQTSSTVPLKVIYKKGGGDHNYPGGFDARTFYTILFVIFFVSLVLTAIPVAYFLRRAIVKRRVRKRDLEVVR